MRDNLSQPTRRPVARVPRRYGSIFNSFDHLANASACAQKLGKVDIDCRFRHSQTQWGVLGETEHPAGILYMDLTFTQPKDCQLSSATVWMSLEDPESVAKVITCDTTPARPTLRGNRTLPRGHSRPELPVTRGKREEFDVQFTLDFGPRQLMGMPTRVTTKKTRHLTPEINVLGNGGGGLGWEYEQSIENSSRWKFTGSLLRGSKLEDNASDIVYRTLKWELSEDKFHPIITHSNAFRTAFTLEHGNQEFFLRIEIQGKLEKRHERMKNHMKHLFKFPRDPSGSQGISLMRFPPQKKEFIRRLDAIAQGLHHDMERLNLQAIPPEVPPALPVSFQEIAPLSRDRSTTTATAIEENITSHSTAEHNVNTRLHDLRIPARISSFPEEEENIVGRAPTNEIPVKTRSPIAESPAQKQEDQATVKVEDERDHKKSPPVLVKEVRPPQPAAEPVRISATLEPYEEKPLDDDLQKLVLQLAQFRLLLRIVQWVVSMMSIRLTPNNVPSKTLESPESITARQDGLNEGKRHKDL